LAHFAPIRSEGYEYKTLIVIGSLAIGILGIVVGTGTGALSDRVDFIPRTLAFFIAIALVFTSCFSCLENASLAELYSAEINEPVRRDYKRGALTALLLALAVVAFALTYHFMLGKPLLAANRFPTLWRSLHILSGVSPMLPQVLF